MEHPKKLLDRYGIDAKKSLGQNFLFDENLLQRIVDAAEITPADTVLEVGPGLGALTKQLARTAGRVIAVELDERFLPILQHELAPYSNVTLIYGDILQQDPATLLQNEEAGYKVVANVPYYITGAILRHLLEAPVKPSKMVLTIQKEVAERLTAEPGDMSLLAVSVQFYGRVEVVTQLAAGAFYPRPNVASSVIAIDLQERPPATAYVQDEAAFFQIVKAGFSQKRKQLHKNLRSLGHEKEAIEQFLQHAGLDGRRRAETLTIDEWVRLYQAMTTPP